MTKNLYAVYFKRTKKHTYFPTLSKAKCYAKVAIKKGYICHTDVQMIKENENGYLQEIYSFTSPSGYRITGNTFKNTKHIGE